MGHDAFYLVDVISSTEGEKLTCITYYGDYLYLGTGTGRILLYRITSKPSLSGAKIEYTSVKEKSLEVNSSRSPIQQIEALPDLNLLAVLCDGGVSLHKLANLDRVPSILDSKGAVSFAVNARAKRICIVLSKRRLRLYEWIEGKFVPLRSHPELDVPDVPRALVYYGPRICLGYQREYNILYEDTGEVRDIAGGMAKDTRPLIKHLPGDNLLIICANEMGVVINANGEPVTSAAFLQFKHHPLSLSYCYPYLLSVGEGSKEVEIHASREGKDETIQTITIPNGVVGMTDGRVGCATTKTDIDSIDGATKGRNPVYIAIGNPGRVIRVQPVPVDRQVEDMIKQYRVAAATELIANTCVDSNVLSNKISRLNIDAGRVFFLGLHFEQAFPFLIASAVDPREILQMFPDLLPGSLSLMLAPSAGSLTENNGTTVTTKGLSGKSSSTTSGKSTTLSTRQIRSASQEFLSEVGLGDNISSSSNSIGTTGSNGGGGLYRVYPSRYFSVPLTHAIASGVKQPSEAATESADALGGSTDLLGAGGLGSFLDGTGNGSIVQTGVADIGAIIKSQIQSCGKRLRGEESTGNNDLSIGNTNSSSSSNINSSSSSSSSSSSNVTVLTEGRILAAYTGILQFLRQRRKIILTALQRYTNNSSNDNNDESADNYDTNNGLNSNTDDTNNNNLVEEEEDDGLPKHTVRVTVKGRLKTFEAHGSSFTASVYTEPELRELITVLDSAIMRCCAALQLIRKLQRLVFNANYIAVPDATTFLRAQGRYQTLALYYLGKGMYREALSIWKEIGQNILNERDIHMDNGNLNMYGKKGDGRLRGQSDNSNSSSRRSSMSSSNNDDATNNRLYRDSLSDFEDLDTMFSHFKLEDEQRKTKTSLALTAAIPDPRMVLALVLSRDENRKSDGIDETILFLRSSNDINLIFEFSEWLLFRDTVKAMAIFIQPLRTKTVPIDKVLDYLSIPKFTEITRRNPAAGVVRLYLEYVIDVVKSTEERYHTRLAREYIASVIQLRGDMPAGGTVYKSTPGTNSTNTTLANRMVLAGTIAERSVPGSEGGTLGDLRTRLLNLLQESEYYDPGALLGLVKDSTLYEERVLLHARLGQNEAALRLLVFELADTDRAIKYCELQTSALRITSWASASTIAGLRGTGYGNNNNVNNSNAPNNGSGDPFLCLLRLYLDAHAQTTGTMHVTGVSSASSVYLGAALSLLSSHAHHMDALAAAKLLPGELTLQSLLGYCSRVLPSSAHAAREALLIKNMYNFRRIDVNADLVKRQERSAIITRNSYCHVCDKRIGDAVFAVLPDNRPVHFHCSREISTLSVACGSNKANTVPTVNKNPLRFAFRLYELSSSSLSLGSIAGNQPNKSLASQQSQYMMYNKVVNDNGNDDTLNEGIDFSHEFGDSNGTDDLDASNYIVTGNRYSSTVGLVPPNNADSANSNYSTGTGNTNSNPVKRINSLRG